MQAATHDSAKSQAPSPSSSGTPQTAGSSGSRGLIQMLKGASFDDGAKMLQPRAAPGDVVQLRRAPVQMEAAAEQAPAVEGAAQPDLTPLFDKLAGAYFPGTQANARAFIDKQPPEVRPALEERLTAYLAEWTGADGKARQQLKSKWKGHYAKYGGGAPTAPASEAQGAPGGTPPAANPETTEAAAAPATTEATDAAAAPAAPVSTEPLTGDAARAQVEQAIQALEATHAANAAKGKKIKKDEKKGYWKGDFRAQLLKGKQLENLVEYSPDEAAQVAHAIGDARALVEKLGPAELGVVSTGSGKEASKAEAAAVREARGKYHRRLNRVEPYFTQMVNDSILGDKYDTKNKKGEVVEGSEATWKGTCNLTSVASALMARGKAPQDFVGGDGKDAALLARVAAALDPGRFSDESAMYGLRMPDFLQLVYIMNKLSSTSADPKVFKAAVMSSRKQCRGTVTDLSKHKKVVEMFGVKMLLWSSECHKENKQFKVKGKFDQQRYISILQQEFIPRLNRGEQVVINKPGHIIRLVDMTSEGIMIDDSAYEGAKFTMDWNKCAAENYFRAHSVYF